MSGIKIGNLDVSVFKVGSADCTIYLGDILLYPQGSHRTRVIRSSNYCSNANMYYDMLYQESDDYGETWTTTATTQVLVENDSYDCGYRTRTTSGSPYCSGSTGYDKYVDVYTEESRDSGTTWATAFTTPTLVEKNSEDCGYTPPPYSATYLTFTATQRGTFKFSGNSVSYSLDDGNTWESLASNTNSPTIAIGKKILWKAELTPSDWKGIGKFSSSGKFEVEGNPMSLLYGDNFADKTSLSGINYAFSNLFSGCAKLTSAENLSLPATTLADNCYYAMFFGCTSLTTAPELPATTLASGCYKSMFQGCTSLTTAPTLSAPTLASSCYRDMFNGCTSLTTAPSLPATTLASYCYSNMFNGCTSLATAPTLSATTLAIYCYQSMFSGCASLTTAPSLPATTLASGCYSQMFQNCTSLTTVPTLSATSVIAGSYYGMFQSCTSLTTAPDILATNISGLNAVGFMFFNCSSLNHIKAMFTNSPNEHSFSRWVASVAANGTFIMNSAAAWSPNTTACGESTYPCNWVIETAST